MRQTVNKKSIGLFLIVGIVAFCLIVGRAIFQKFWSDEGYPAVMYFEESIQGLREGSSVVLNGVEVGKVEKIELVANAEDLTFQVPVYVRLEPITKEKNKSLGSFTLRENLLEMLIQKGLRAQLLTQSYLTGQLMIELGMAPNTPIHLVHSPRDEENNIPEIPTILSPGSELVHGIQDLPIKAIFDKMDQVLAGINDVVPVLKQTITAYGNIATTVEPKTPDTLYNVNEAVNNFSDAMRSLRILADYLERYPESLLRGKK